MHTCTHVHAYVCAYISMHTNPHRYINACIHTHTHKHVQKNEAIKYSIRMHTHTCTQAHTYVRKHESTDSSGNETRDPNQVAALLPFGAHKGYSLGLIDELFAAYGGGSLPTIRVRAHMADWLYFTFWQANHHHDMQEECLRER